MLGFLLTLLILSSVTFAVSSGDTHAISEAALSGGTHAISLCFTLSSAMALWGGIMNIAEKSNVTQVVTSIVKHPLKLLFSDADEGCIKQVSMNVTANLLGLGNAAFPTGIKAMKLINKRNLCDRSKVFFLLLNTASIQLIPLTVSRLRGLHGAKNIWDCTAPTIITSIIALTVGLITAAVICPKNKTE